MTGFCRLLAVLALAISFSPRAALAASEVPDGAAVIAVDDWRGPPVRAFAMRPATAGDDAPVVFVMHGVRRDADRYFNDWRGLAERYGFVLVTPEFTAEAFPGAAAYNLGGIDPETSAADRQSSAYAIIEPLFDQVREAFNLTAEDYTLYGHSAGAQYVHRFALFGFGPRARMIISANAGWYTFPDASDWPYGFGGLSGDLVRIDSALAAPLVVLAGEADTDPEHPSLRRTDEAMRQGRNRFDRALAFYAAGASEADKINAPFGWACATAPGVDHNDAKAAPFAVAIILDGPPQAGQPCRKGASAD